MTSYSRSINAITTEVNSPLRTVRVSVTRQNETYVTFLPGARKTRDPYTIAEEIEGAVLQAWSEAKEADRELRQQLGFTVRDPVDPDTAPRWWHEFRDEVWALEVTATSSRKLVDATMDGEGHLFVEFRSNATIRTDVSTETLEMEVNEAIRQARAALMQQVKKVHRKLVQTIQTKQKA